MIFSYLFPERLVAINTFLDAIFNRKYYPQ